MVKMQLEIIFNQCEAALWFLVAAAFAITALVKWRRSASVPAYHRHSIIAFALFGVSDVIESQTGAWWTPWWLFVLKSLCVLVFVYCFTAYRKALKARRETDKTEAT
ncbi:MAG: hypothetical protein WCN98_09505 [Verrucomicrobiaceae bacterium]